MKILLPATVAQSTAPIHRIGFLPPNIDPEGRPNARPASRFYGE
jgi:hypothetical protein